MKYSNHKVDDSGWTDWLKPNMQLYKIACCDCGLVHDIQFRIENDYIFLKVRRNNRATGQKRRHRKK